MRAAIARGGRLPPRRRWLEREGDGISLADFRRLLQAERDSGLEQIREIAERRK